MMQTFLPFADFEETARVLDGTRLARQLVDNVQIMTALLEPSEAKRPWIRDPATAMWKGHEFHLGQYHLALCEEFARRGFDPTLYTNSMANLLERNYTKWSSGQPAPPWLGKEGFHSSHQSQLLMARPDHYEKYFHPDTPTNLEFMWPRGRRA